MLLVVLLASACDAGNETVPETVTVTTATTVRVTETSTGTTTAPPAGWNGLAEPLPASGELPVDDFNAYAESVDEAWERDLAGVTDRYLGPVAGEAQSRSFATTAAGEGAGSATASLRLDGLFDDSVRSRSYDLTLSRREDGTWRVDTARWAQRCHEGRGHQAFSPEPCL